MKRTTVYEAAKKYTRVTIGNSIVGLGIFSSDARSALMNALTYIHIEDPDEGTHKPWIIPHDLEDDIAETAEHIRDGFALRDMRDLNETALLRMGLADRYHALVSRLDKEKNDIEARTKAAILAAGFEL